MPPYLAVILLALLVALMLAFHVLIVYWALRRSFSWFSIQTTNLVVEVGIGNRSSGLSRGDIDKLPSYNFINGDHSGHEQDDEAVNGSTVCAICLEAFCPGEKCRLLPPCKHSFHAECIDSWLIKCSLCPICRGSVEIIEGRDRAVIEIPESSSSSAFGHN